MITITTRNNKRVMDTNAPSIWETFWCKSKSERLCNQHSFNVFKCLLYQSIPQCLSRKPKRAESEIPSLPEAGLSVALLWKAAWKDQRVSPEGATAPYCAAVPWPNSPGPCSLLLLACLVYLGRTFNPGQPSWSVFCLFCLSHPSLQHVITYLQQIQTLISNLQLCDKHRSFPAFSGGTSSMKVTLGCADSNPDESAGRISALPCLYFLPRSTMDTVPS